MYVAICLMLLFKCIFIISGYRSVFVNYRTSFGCIDNISSKKLQVCIKHCIDESKLVCTLFFVVVGGRDELSNIDLWICEVVYPDFFVLLLILIIQGHKFTSK